MVLLKGHIYFLKTRQSFSALIRCTFWAGLFFAVETVLCTVGFLSTSLVYLLDATCILPVITTQSASRHGQSSLCVVCVCVLSCLEITTLSRTTALIYLASTYPYLGRCPCVLAMKQRCVIMDTTIGSAFLIAMITYLTSKHLLCQPC